MRLGQQKARLGFPGSQGLPGEHVGVNIPIWQNSGEGRAPNSVIGGLFCQSSQPDLASRALSFGPGSLRNRLGIDE